MYIKKYKENIFFSNKNNVINWREITLDVTFILFWCKICTILVKWVGNVLILVFEFMKITQSR